MMMQRKSRFLQKHANSRSGQAALEFIMTYGWAILVVLVAIAALAYFGVLSPDRFLPSKCTMQAGIACLDHKATATTVEIDVQNSLGRDITVDTLTAAQCPCLGTGCTDPVPNPILNNGGADTYTMLNCNNVGSKYNGRVNITYTVIDTQIQHINQGEITTRIE